MLFSSLRHEPAAADFFLSSRRRHTPWNCDWSSDVCSSDLGLLMLAGAIVLTAGLSGPTSAQEAGRIKVSSGTVQIERGGQKLPATVGTAVQAGDVISTGSNGSVGITFLDN